MSQIVKPDTGCLYKIKLKSGRIFETDRAHLQYCDDVDIACIPTEGKDYEREIPNLSDEDLSFLAHPTPLSKDDEDWLYHHNRLNHLGRSEMHKLAVAGVLPKNLQQYKLKSPFCASCAFGKAHRRQWRHKGDDINSTRSKRDNKQGAKVSEDQMVSVQPGLVPQTSRYLTRSRIHSSTIYIDHFSSFDFRRRNDQFQDSI